MTVLYAAGERRRDQLELGVYQSMIGRGISYMNKDERAAELAKLAKRVRRQTPGTSTVDRAYTASETARWAAILAQGGEARA